MGSVSVVRYWPGMFRGMYRTPRTMHFGNVSAKGGKEVVAPWAHTCWIISPAMQSRANVVVL